MKIIADYDLIKWRTFFLLNNFFIIRFIGIYVLLYLLFCRFGKKKCDEFFTTQKNIIIIITIFINLNSQYNKINVLLPTYHTFAIKTIISIFVFLFLYKIKQIACQTAIADTSWIKCWKKKIFKQFILILIKGL